MHHDNFGNKFHDDNFINTLRDLNMFYSLRLNVCTHDKDVQFTRRKNSKENNDKEVPIQDIDSRLVDFVVRKGDQVAQRRYRAKVDS